MGARAELCVREPLLRRWLRLWRYGEPVIVVSGLPRSGTSMMMRMLEAGGLPTLTDGCRTPDPDNPHGYFELERVKALDKAGDKSWVRKGRGRAMKVISHLLRELPDENFYRVVFMRRDLEEVIVSQNKMLVHRQEPNPLGDARAQQAFRRHIIDVKAYLRARPNFQMLEVPYRETLASPREMADRIGGFLGGRLDPGRMAAAVDAQLYRNRSGALASQPPAPS